MTTRDFRFPKPFRFGHIGHDDEIVGSTSGLADTSTGPMVQPVFSAASGFPQEKGMSYQDRAFGPSEFTATARPVEAMPKISNPKVLEDLDKLDELTKLPFDDLVTYQDKKKPKGSFQGESYALPGSFIERDPHVADRDMALKLQALVDKLNDYKKQLKDLVQKNMEVSEDAVKKEEKVFTLEQEKKDLEDQLADLGMQKDGKGKFNIFKSIGMNALDEAEQRRRTDQKKELMMGLALEDDIGDLLGRKDQEKNCVQRLSEALYRIMLKFTLLKADLKHVEAYYDKSIGAYFTFYKYLVNASLFILIVFGYLLISHPFLAEDKNLGICGGSPCILMYYSYSSSEDITYSATIFAFIAITFTASIWKWIRSDAVRRRLELYVGKDLKLKKFSATVFNCWDWSLKTQTDTAEHSVSLYNLLSTFIADDARMDAAKLRTQAQTTRIRIRRVFSLILNVILLVIGWALIALILVFSKNFSDLFDGTSSVVIFFIKLIPVLCVSLVNWIVPAITLKLTTLEQWDEPAYQVKVQIIKLYFARIMNAVIYAGLNLDLAVNNQWFGSTSRIEFQSSTFNCREDQAGLNFVLMVISDAIMSKVMGITLPLLDRCMAGCRKKQWVKREIKVAQQVINLIYSQTLIWLTYPYYPYVAVLGPVFLFIDFKFQLWRLKRLLAKPKEQTQASDIVILIMRFYNLTFVLVLGYYSYIFTQSIAHGTYGANGVQCGAFKTNEPAKTSLVNAITGTTVTAFIWDNFVYYAPFMWLIAVLFYTRNAFKGNYLAIALKYMTEKEDELMKKIRELNTRIVKLNHRIKMGRNVLE